MATHNITPLPVKFELHAYGSVHDVSNFIANWKELEISLKRDGTSGVFHEISFPFQFVLDARDVLTGLFNQYQYRAVADIYIYIRRDDWAYNPNMYHSPQIFNLDFITYEETDTKVEIETKKVSLYDFLKSKGKVTYDIPVTDIREEKPFYFDRIELENMIVFRCVADGTTGYVSSSQKETFGVSQEKTEVGVQDFIFVNTMPFGKPLTNSTIGDNDKFMFYNKSKTQPMTIHYDIDIKGLYNTLSSSYPQVNIGLLSFTKNDLDGVISSYTTSGLVTNFQNIFWRDSNTFTLNPGEGCYLTMGRQQGYLSGQQYAKLDGTITIRYNARNEPVNIDVISPKTLLQRLVNKITETTGVYTSDIEDFNNGTQNRIMLSAAESVRGIEPVTEIVNNEEKIISVGAQVHTSYNDFLKWMNAFGYEEHIIGKNLTMKRRFNGFLSNTTAIELSEKDCADMKKYVDEDYIFSGVKIGYERKNIENANVRFEFNGKHDYSSDLSITDKVLELVSPYRADCYGIEFLAQERLKETTDNKADKDMFIIHVYEDTENYKAIRSVFSGNVLTSIGTGANNNSMFNGGINPFLILQRNLDLIGVSVKLLKFTASDSNAEIEIDGMKINGDCAILPITRLFDPIMYDIASKNILHLPSDAVMNGIVRFTYKGVVYEGFIDEISKNPAWEAETTWKLRKKK